MNLARETLNSKMRLRLQDELAKRLRSNPRYSLRAYSRDLDLNSSTLSQILSGKRTLSETKVQQILERAGIPPVHEEDPEFSMITQDTFLTISEWYHFAILDLTLLKDFKSDISWIGKKLGLHKFEAQSAVQRLLRLGLLEERRGRLQKSKRFYSNYSEGETSQALKEYQRQVIRKALEAIDSCPQERKDITSITIAANSKKLHQAKKIIKTFRRQLCEFLEEGDRDAVYHLTVQLYPVTDGTKDIV